MLRSKRRHAFSVHAYCSRGLAVSLCHEVWQFMAFSWLLCFQYAHLVNVPKTIFADWCYAPEGMCIWWINGSPCIFFLDHFKLQWQIPCIKSMRLVQMLTPPTAKRSASCPGPPSLLTSCSKLTTLRSLSLTLIQLIQLLPLNDFKSCSTLLIPKALVSWLCRRWRLTAAYTHACFLWRVFMHLNSKAVREREEV